jgi:hypothetical protein
MQAFCTIRGKILSHHSEKINSGKPIKIFNQVVIQTPILPISRLQNLYFLSYEGF